MTKTRNKITVALLALLLVVAVFAGLFVFANPQKAYAAGNTGEHTFYGTENISHDAIFLGTDYTENVYRSTGIKLYSTSNNGTVTTGNSVKIDTNSFYVDFADAVLYYAGSDMTVQTKSDTSFKFEILNSSGSVVWYASFTGTSSTNDEDVTTYKKTININGSSTTKSSTSGFNFSLASDFGRRSVTLSSGKYSIKISRKYSWVGKPASTLFPGMYSSTSTMTGSLLIDYTKPTLSAKGYSTGSTITNGSYIKERVTFTASDTNFYRLYYKTPSSSSYSSTTNKTYTTGTTNGWYYGYAVDSVGNQTDTFSFYYDSAVPTGKISSGGTTVNSGAYVSKSFSYSATDSGSGIANYYYKTPTSGSYQQYSPGTIIPASAGDGWYYFYSVDRSGNQSATMSVYLETRQPLVEIYHNGTLAYSKGLSASGSFDTGLYLQPNDTLKISCDTSSGKVTSNYTLDTNITIGNNYPNSSYTITVTSATGISGNFTYHIVREQPTFVIGGTTYNDGDTVYLKEDALVSWACSDVIKDTANTGVSIVSEGNINVDEFLRYADSDGKTLTTADGTETKYILTQTDRAGNVSTLTVYIDKSAPVGVWTTNGDELANGGYTKYPLAFEFDEAGVSATYSFNGGEYAAYTSGTVFEADGSYTVVLTDFAGNKSYFTAYIDTVAPTGQLYSDYNPVANGTVTSGRIYFSWEGNATATVNGNAYTKNSVIAEDAVYTFVLTDAAGNSTTYSITVDTVAPSYNADKLNGSSQMISRWYTVTLGGEQYSFATYEEALEYACEYEFKSAVTVLNLDSVDEFNQFHLVASNGSAENTDDEVRTGEYWLYKSKTNPDSLLYYFDRNLLNDVIAHYAKDNVSEVNYFELDGDNEYGNPADSMSDNILLAPDGTAAPVLNGFIFDKADSAELYTELVGGDGAQIKVEFGIAFDEQISVGGLYKLTEIDAAGNETVYYGYLDVASPELKVTATIFGNKDATELTISKDVLEGIAAYYYESFNVNSIVDADKWSLMTVENSGKTAFYTYGDELPTLNIGGEYLITLYDRTGNGYSFTVYIVGNQADIAFKNNSDDTAFDLKITLEQNFDTLVSLEIRRNGELLGGVSTDKLSYTFDKAGVYTVTLRDNFGRVIEREYTFVKSLPVGELLGVENGGKTKGDVNFIFDESKYYAVVTKDGKVIEMSGNELMFVANNANSGEYVIRLINLTDDENFSEYAFTINTLAPAFAMSVENGATTNQDVTVSWTAEDIVKVTYSLNGGEAVELENGQILTAEGTYIIVATNDLGTTNEMTFTVDKTLDYYLVVGEQVANVETTRETVVVFSNENLYISVMKNGEAMTYVFGDVLSDEGVYSFRITDDFGNAVTFTVTIDKSVDYSANVGNGMISNGGVQFQNGEKLTVTVMKDKEVIDYAFGQSIDEEGEYRVILYDAYGNEKVVEFRIVKGVKTVLDYTLGEGVEILSIDRDGESVTAEGNRLNFIVDGKYTVTARVDGETYSFVLELDSTAPTVVLTGVENGGVAGGNVTVGEPSEEAKVEVYFNGELIPYELGSELNEYGEYRVVVTDEVGNVSEYTFTLKYVMNGGTVALIVIGILALIGIVVGVVLGKRAIYKKKNAENDTAEEVIETDENEGDK